MARAARPAAPRGGHGLNLATIRAVATRALHMRAFAMRPDWPHIHIMINHFPVILVVMGTLAALLGMFRSRRGTWLYASATLTLAALTAIPTYFTGEPAQHALNRPWYVARTSIHSHEEAALVAIEMTQLLERLP